MPAGPTPLCPQEAGPRDENKTAAAEARRHRESNKRARTTYNGVGKEQSPLESIPVTLGPRTPTLLSPEQAGVDAIVVVVAFAGHTRFVALERLPATPLLGDDAVVALAIPLALRDEGVGELGRKVVDTERRGHALIGAREPIGLGRDRQEGVWSGAVAVACERSRWGVEGGVHVGEHVAGGCASRL